MVVAFVEGMARADYDPVRHQVSLLSLADRGWIQVANFLGSGLLIVGFAAGLRRVVTPGRAANAGPVAVGAAGSGLVIAGLFSVQPSFGYPPGAPAGIPAPEAGSYLHVLGAFLFFFGMVVAAFMFAARFRAANAAVGWPSRSVPACWC